MTDTLDHLRRAHRQIADYEQSRDKRRGPRNARELRPHLAIWRRHLAQWAAVAEAAGSDEASPLAPVWKQWCNLLGIQPAQSPAAGASPADAAVAPAKAQAKGRKQQSKGKQPQSTKQPTGKQYNPKGGTSQTSGAPPAEPFGAAAGAGGAHADDDPADKLLGKGDWLESHARIVREQIPRVKAAAADPNKYLAAKRDFLKRNLGLLREYIKTPKQGHSPLFAYCVLFLADTGRHDDALALAEQAVALGQTSAIKRNFHELLFDVRLDRLEREAPEVAKAGAGPRFETLTALRDQLMGDPFRGQHAKAKVAKTYAQVCMAVGDYDAARKNLLEVKFMDPNMGVETLLATCEEKLSPPAP